MAHDAPCTAPARTVVDVSRSASFRQAVVVGDAALRQLCTRSEMAVAFDECSAWADLGTARRAFEFLDARSESALESVSRAIMREQEVPAPELQFTVAIDSWTSYRLDFFWTAAGVVGEADGMSKYEAIDAVKAEKVRQERLERLGLKVVRWTWREMLIDTDETIARIRYALLR
jgi:very-short-patch-repair endonuclease